MAKPPDKWTLDGFLSHFMRVEKDRPDRSFAFLLGAGASKPSGIPTGAELVERWLNELHERYVQDRSALPLEKWATAENLEIEKFAYSRAAEFYPHVFERRFREDSDEGYAYLEKTMEGVEPSFGYSVLARIMANTRHSVVITTNFDDLVADALSMFAHKRPLVCGHESLTNFIRPRMRRPLVAKIHRDLLLEPQNTQAGISELAAGWKDALARLLKSYEVIVIGYGGNDGSLMGLLEKAESKDLAGRIFWCYHEDREPDQRVQNLLKAKAGVMVPIPGFDELMMLLNERLKFELLADEIEKQGGARAKKYRDQFEATKASLRQKREASEGAREASDAAARLAEKQTGWWGYELKAQSESDPVKKEQIYRDGLQEFKDSPELMNNFANLLRSVLKKHDEAEALYRRALELAPEDATYMRNLALFLQSVRKQYDEAERLFRRALELAPDSALIMGNLATLLHGVRKQYDEAEALYRRTLELAPDDAKNIGNLALFLHGVRKQYDEAERLYRRALELAPDNASIIRNLAIFLHVIRTKYDEAEALYRRALELAPDNADIVGNLAIFLQNVRKKYNEAEALYRRALELAPDNANNMTNLANLLKNVRKKYKEAEALYRRALELAPGDAGIMTSLANLLSGVLKRHDEAEALYRRALELAPDNVNIMVNAAWVSLAAGKIAEAKERVRRAWPLCPKEGAQVTAEAALYRGLISRVEDRDDASALGRLKALFNVGFDRSPWSFDGVLATAKGNLSDEDNKLYAAIAAAILDADNVGVLAKFARWKKTGSIGLDVPWPDDQERR